MTPIETLSIETIDPPIAQSPELELRLQRGDIPTTWQPLPDHTQLPESDGTFVKNFQEHPQSILLTDSIASTLDAIHPDGHYAIGQDCGIYWRITQPPERGAEAPDWFYVPNAPPMPSGTFRRSYVMWQEIISPLIALEFVSGDGAAEKDATPFKGKFWVYEQAVKIPFYGIYDVSKPSLEFYELVSGRYQPMVPNAQGRYSIPMMNVEIGLWHGTYQTVELDWVRWWDAAGNLLPTGHERADQESQRATQESQRADEALQRAESAQAEADRLATKLRELGIDPTAL
jgi:Uma2 family endonuclease